jgi:hypothetical protein
MNNIIKFSHSYPKLHNQEYARLLDVFEIDDTDLNDELKIYDTHWIEEGEEGFYELPKGKLIQLIFYGELRIPFCTIRRFTQEKLKYYKSKIGESFKIEIIKELK